MSAEELNTQNKLAGIAAKMLAYFQGPRKWEAFLYAVIAITLISAIVSFLTRVIFLRDNPATRPILAVIANDKTPEGKSVLDGVRAFANTLNAADGYNRRQIDVQRIDDTPEAAATILSTGRAIAVVGGVHAQEQSAALKKYHDAKLPYVTVGRLPEGASTEYQGSIGVDEREEARFVANYARNIVQSRIAYVVRDEGSRWIEIAQPFEELYAKFDTPIQKTFVIPPGETAQARAQAIATELRKLDFGTLYLAADSTLSAHVVSAMRKQGVALNIIGPSTLSTGLFRQTLRELSGDSASAHAHGIVAATPALFDTAGDAAQRFQSDWLAQHGQAPDWLAVLAHDGALRALNLHAATGGQSAQVLPKPLIESFGASRTSPLPIQIGLYSGLDLISAPVQLLPMAKGAQYDYMGAIKDGRILYVNDRFMFRSNVVYTGMTFHRIDDISAKNETAQIDFSIWFRFKGSFDPSNIIFTNAIEPIKFPEPEEKKELGDVQYHRYRIKAKFKIDYNAEPRVHNEHMIGVTFRHKLLNRNNVIFVGDVLGMPTGKALADDMTKRKVSSVSNNMVIDSAWISQDILRMIGEGAPQYVGNTGEAPLFSAVTVGARLKTSDLSPLDFFDREHLIYLAITGVVGLLFAKALDARQLGRFLTLQTWVLRAMFAPLTLLGLGTLAIDRVYVHGSQDAINLVVHTVGALWWLIGAWLADIAFKRFVWDPLEARAGRKIPNIMKVMVTIIILTFAIAGIVAQVLGQPLTSLLATSGVLAMIVGLAIQANIANVFSGIILNIERPFRVGDFIKINNVVGQVKDITWRTIRMESSDGPTVSLANSKVSESFMENYSQTPNGIAAEVIFNMPPESDPQPILQVLTDVLAECPQVFGRDNPVTEPIARYRGVVSVEGRLYAQFAAGYRVATLPKRGAAREFIWKSARSKFIEQGIAYFANDDDSATSAAFLKA